MPAFANVKLELAMTEPVEPLNAMYPAAEAVFPTSSFTKAVVAILVLLSAEDCVVVVGEPAKLTLSAIWSVPTASSAILALVIASASISAVATVDLTANAPKPKFVLASAAVPAFVPPEAIGSLSPLIPIELTLVLLQEAAQQTLLAQLALPTRSLAHLTLSTPTSS